MNKMQEMLTKLPFVGLAIQEWFTVSQVDALLQQNLTTPNPDENQVRLAQIAELYGYPIEWLESQVSPERNKE